MFDLRWVRVFCFNRQFVTISAVSSGLNHVVVRVKNGDMYSWGENVSFHKPLAGTAFEGKRIKQIACGNHTLALNAEGEIYAWGANGFGQLGNGNVVDDNNGRRGDGNDNNDENERDSEDENESDGEDDSEDDVDIEQPQDSKHPVKIMVGEKVKITQIACGDETSYALDKHGKVRTDSSLCN